MPAVGSSSKYRAKEKQKRGSTKFWKRGMAYARNFEDRRTYRFFEEPQ